MSCDLEMALFHICCIGDLSNLWIPFLYISLQGKPLSIVPFSFCHLRPLMSPKCAADSLCIQLRGTTLQPLHSFRWCPRPLCQFQRLHLPTCKEKTNALDPLLPFGNVHRWALILHRWDCCGLVSCTDCSPSNLSTSYSRHHPESGGGCAVVLAGWHTSGVLASLWSSGLLHPWPHCLPRGGDEQAGRTHWWNWRLVWVSRISDFYEEEMPLGEYSLSMLSPQAQALPALSARDLQSLAG